ncbi:MAG TPA: hypothetical protein DF783_00930, partial [Acidimicrobiaceae bacterium]|nr:hypothetical protein [Acidimicrobiaceae bacterium]
AVVAGAAAVSDAAVVALATASVLSFSPSSLPQEAATMTKASPTAIAWIARDTRRLLINISLIL